MNSTRCKRKASERTRHGSCTDYCRVYYYSGFNNDARLPGGMFLLELSSDGVATWSQPRQVFSGIRPKCLNSFGMIFCQGALLLLVGHIGVKPFLYDLKTRRFAREQLGVPSGFEGLGDGVSPILLENARVVGLFNYSWSEYLRISVEV